MNDNETYYSNRVSSLKNDRKRYVDLKNLLQGSLIPALSKSTSSLNIAIDSMPSSFTINDNGIDKDSLKDEKDNIESIISKLNGTVISEINTKIGSIDNSIEFFNYLLRKEKEKKSE